MADDPNCTTIFCISPATFLDPGSLTIAVNPTGSGGKALNLNFQTLQYRQPQCQYTGNLRDPGKGNDISLAFCPGSRWLNLFAGGGSAQAMWICTSNTLAKAVWSPWAFWLDPATWAGGTAGNGALGALVNQGQSLAYANAHFSIEGEYRSIYFNNPSVGSPLVLVPQQTTQANGAVVLGIHGAPPGGSARGASAVDFQNLRANDAQVASGPNSFIAGGQNNKASAQGAHAQGFSSQATAVWSHAEGTFSQATGSGSHAEGACASDSTKIASGQGAHAQGNAQGAGAVTASGDGSHAGGSADGGGIEATQNGSHSTGYADTNGLVSASDNGAHAQGSAQSSGQIVAGSAGAHATGYVYAGTITATSEGAHAHGSAENSGTIVAGTGNGAFATGSSDGGLISATGGGAHAHGLAAEASGQINASGAGAHATGSADNGTIAAGGEGAHAQGSADTGQITATDNGAFALGSTESGGTITAGNVGNASGAFATGSANSGAINAGGEGAHAQGSAETLGQITATDNGAFALGSAESGGTITAGNAGNANGAFATGSANSGAIAAGGEGAHAQGSAETTGAIIAADNGAFALGSAENGGTITAGNAGAANGAFAAGSANNGAIASGGEGSHALGSAENSGRISASANGAIATGSANGGQINATNEGARAQGSAENGATLAAANTGAYASGAANYGTISASGEGAHAQGNAGVDTTTTGGQLLATTDGSHVEGNAEDGSFIQVLTNIITGKGKGGHAEGSATNHSNIQVNGEGAHAEGSAENYAVITASDNGAHVEGSASGPLSALFAGFDSSSKTANAEGAHCEGSAENGGLQKATGTGAHAEGAANYGSKIASGEGAHVEGSAGVKTTTTGGQITATGSGSHAEGNAEDGGVITATGDGAHAEGFAGAGQTTTASGKGARAEGCNTTASGDYSSAGGTSSQATLLAQSARASGMFSTPGDAQVTRTTMFVATTDTTPTELTLDGQTPGTSNRYTLVDNHSYAITLTIAARDTTGAVFAMFKRMLIIQQTSGTVTLIGSVQTIGTDINPSALTISISADSTNQRQHHRQRAGRDRAERRRDGRGHGRRNLHRRLHAVIHKRYRDAESARAMTHCDRCPLRRHRRPCPAQWYGCSGACALAGDSVMRHELVRRAKPDPTLADADDFRGMLPSAYWEREHLADEVVTLFVPLSGREGPWETHLRPWLDGQTWPRAQTRLVLADTSQRAGFGAEVQAWLARSGYPDARYYTQIVGREGLASLPRPNDGGVEVNSAMRAIYARMAAELATRFVLVVEDDHAPPADALGRLLRGMDARTAALSGLYRGREPAGNWVCWSHRQHELQPTPGPAVPVAGSGFGCLLLKRDPWLVSETFEHVDGVPYPYDIGFAYRVERSGGVWKADRSVLCEHAGAPPIPPAWHATAAGLAPVPRPASTLTMVAPAPAVPHGTELEVLSIVERCDHARVCTCTHRGLVECQPGGRRAGTKVHPRECEACLVDSA